ncbi:MAG: polysaccharide export protein [Magnetococcales bacterium]|nr:polysaccharide export protein [Magnetococcales bacterium]
MNTCRLLFMALLVVVSLLGGACAQLHPKPITPENVEPWQDDFGAYRLSPGDELDVRLLHNPEFNDKVVIGPDGRIQLALVGVVAVEGKTVAEVTRILSLLFAEHLRRPELTVLLRAVQSQVVFVGGEVQKPGMLTIQTSRMSVAQVLMMAGGLLPTAHTRQIVLLRRHPDKTKPMLRIINLQSILEGTNMAEDIPLRRNDVLFVPRSDIAEMDLWVDQYITRILPFNRDYTISRSSGNP